MKKITSFIIIVIAASYSWYLNSPSSVAVVPSQSKSVTDETDRIISSAYDNKRSNIQVQGVGELVKILADDTKGSRHQKFILRLASGQTLLVAHNIDLAPRIGRLQVGDAVGFHGEYEWSERGGVVHWTHRDPAGRHAHGWLEHGGQRYQ